MERLNSADKDINNSTILPNLKSQYGESNENSSWKSCCYKLEIIGKVQKNNKI